MFDTQEELLRQIRLGEDTSLEFKAVRFRGANVSTPKRDELADEIAAIANTHDGVLVLGVDDKTRDIIGIPIGHLEAVERFIFEICSDSVEPPVLFRSFRMELADGAGVLQPVIKIEIPRSLFLHKSPGGYFYRQGSSSREMSTELLLRIGQERSQARLISFDEQPVPETSIGDLDETLRQRFVGGTQDERATLRKLMLLTDDDSGKERTTVAGILMCSRRPDTCLPAAFIQAVRYRGTRQDSNYQVDAQEITGPLDEQVSGALRFVRKNMTVMAKKDPARVELPQFSLRAVFEAIVNAVAHRDYSIHGSRIRLFIFDDRLECYSPGALPNTVTIDNIDLRQSTRNELVTRLLAKCPTEDASGDLGRSFLMERRGDGVPIIFEQSRRLSGRQPDYRLIDNAEVLLTIYGATPSKAVGGES